MIPTIDRRIRRNDSAFTLAKRSGQDTAPIIRRGKNLVTIWLSLQPS